MQSSKILELIVVTKQLILIEQLDQIQTEIIYFTLLKKSASKRDDSVFACSSDKLAELRSKD